MAGKIGSQGSGFEAGSKGNIFKQMDLGDCVMQERFDFSDPNNPTVDYDIRGVSHRLNEKLLGEVRHIKL